ncbi:MAG TPA: hypothetical protein VGO33_15940 [Gemmatimonadaceae bacterium]|nr:hypothetical protein [Gemmatimonadaceae bacterium]
MTQVQLAVSGTQSDVTGVSRVTITDPAAEVRTVGFYLTGRDRRRIGPLAADRAPGGGVYEKDLLLDARELTRVQAEIVLADGTVLNTQPTMFGTRFEPLAAPAGALASLSVTPQPSRLDIAVTRGSAFIWKCYAKNGSVPTVDGIAGSSLDQQFLRFNESEIEGADPRLSFSMAAGPGTWNIIALGFNNAGQPGPRFTSAVQVTS